MNNEENKKEQEREEMLNTVEVSNFNWMVPECCREGWETCPHVVKRAKKTKSNIGL